MALPALPALPAFPALQAAALLLALALGLRWALVALVPRIRVKSVLRNLPGPPSASWLSGNLDMIYDPANIAWHHETTRKYGGVVKYHALFGDEQLYFTDPRAIHHILVKEGDIFDEPTALMTMNRALLGNGLLATRGKQHTKQRKLLQPVFSAKHMRHMTPVFTSITNRLCTLFEAKLSEAAAAEIEINVYEWTSRSALETIAQGGLGLSLDSLVEGETSTYTRVVKDLVPTLSRMHVAMQFLPLTNLLHPGVRRFLARHAPFRNVQKLRGIVEHIDATSRGVVEAGKAALAREAAEGAGAGAGAGGADKREKKRDLLSVLLRENAEAAPEDRMDDDEVVGQLTTMIFAAQDTTAAAVSRVLHTLATHPDAQERVRREVRHARAEAGAKGTGTEWDYDALMALPYLDAVVRETLRLYTPNSYVWRVARKATTLPLLRPVVGTDGQRITAVPVAQWQQVVVGVTAANRDEATWGADAWQWVPERWLTPEQRAEDALTGGDEWKKVAFEERGLEREGRLPGVYSGMMTFAGGGRACIGFKFALLQIKTVVSMFVERFHFAPSEHEIAWNMNHIVAPVLKGKEKETPQLPLKVSLA